MEQYNEGEADDTRRLELDSVEEARLNALVQSARHLQGVRRHYDKNVHERTFQVSDLVLKRRQKTDALHKLLNPWEGPYIVSKVIHPGTFELQTTDDTAVPNTWNIEHLTRFYA